MALRSRSRTGTPTSGPGRGPGSDGRTRHLPRHYPGHVRERVRPHARRHRRTPAADTLRLRAEALFTEGTGERQEFGNDPPGAAGDRRQPRGSTATGRGTCGFRAPTAMEPGASAEPVGPAGPVKSNGRAVRVGPIVPTGLSAPVRPVRPAGLAGPVSVDSVEPVEPVESEPGEAAGPAPPVTPAAGGIGTPVHGATGSLRMWRDRWGPAVRERMPLWLQSRCALERKSVAALSVLLVVAAVLAAQHFWAGRTRQVRAPEVVRAAAPYGAPGGNRGERSVEPGAPAGPQPGDGPGAGLGAGPGTGAAVVVDVSGKVRRPGLLRLPAGSRVADALRAAGGVRPGTDTDALNRARLLVDGEQIVVGGPPPVTGGNPVGPVTGGSVAGAVPATPVSLTVATVDQLDALPGVGPVLARHIVDYRDRHGGFRSVDELRHVNGIGERRFADLRNLVRP